uniref:alkaline phosphatase n=1 Tax=Steinernema glaseri TaxID=37863 RepID=A0A1I8A539_9BILA
MIFSTFLVCAYIILPVYTADLQATSYYWDSVSQNRLNTIVQNDPVLGAKENVVAQKPPKNLIFFIGDGMGITAVSAGRIYRGQKMNLENNQDPLNFEKFQSSCLVKTYCYDKHVTDSAAGAVALFSGQKVVHHTLGLDATITSNVSCENTEDKKLNNLISMLALNAGKSVGFVTTTRITHATPAALYANTVYRYSESDVDVQKENMTGCKDIASQLLDYPANQFQVLMGGGRSKLLPKEEGGSRGDHRNIMKEWQNLSGNRASITTRDELLNIDDKTEHLLGVFSDSHLMYAVNKSEEDTKTQPTLEEMTTAAIKVLSKNPKGYILMVEGGQIDLAEHDNKMRYALEELLEFDKAIGAAADIVNAGDDTLMLVTADHSHTLTMPGYLNRSESIFGSSIYDYGNIDNLPIASLMFANGPGGFQQSNATHVYRRTNLTEVNTEDIEYVSPAAVPLKSSTHSGEDVGLWAHGPYSRLFTGTIENTQVAFTVKYVLCLEQREANLCSLVERTNSQWGTATVGHSIGVLVFSILAAMFSFCSMILLAVQLLMKYRTQRVNEASSKECLRKF